MDYVTVHLDIMITLIKLSQNGEIGLIYSSNKDIIIIYLQIYCQHIYNERLPEIQPVTI